MFEGNPYCNQDLLLSCLTSYPCCHRWLVLPLIFWMGLALFSLFQSVWVFEYSKHHYIIQYNTKFNNRLLICYVLFVKQVQLSQTFSEVWREFYFKNIMRFYHFIDAMPSSSFCTQPKILYLIAIIECF